MENLTFDQRAAFTADLTDLVRKLDGQISALNAKRSTMTANTGDWDFAMKEVNAARSYLVGLETEVATATPDTWGEEKDRVGGAWRRASTFVWIISSPPTIACSCGIRSRIRAR
jgi:hypothetical protein